MALRINTNVSALNTLRQLNQSGASLAKSIGRLSSGRRINSASDDAAGLGIANKLRADIRALKQAGRNAEQANSMLQVAEGAAQTIQNIVERMKELGLQAASDNVSDTDRVLINAEYIELKSEITRVVDTSEFQGTSLVDGTLGNVHVAGAGSDTIDDITAVADAGGVTISGTSTGQFDVTQTTTAVTMTNGGKSQTLSGLSAGGQTLSFDLFGIDIVVDSSFNVTANSETFDSDAIVVSGGNTEFVVSVTGAPDGNDRVLLGTMDLQLSTLTTTGTMTSKALAVTELAAIDVALSKIATTFGTIGAAQNRIGFARQNTAAVTENFAAAESVIRDVDMAAEVTQMTKFQILQQAGTAVLAQANSAPQTILSLLR